MLVIFSVVFLALLGFCGIILSRANGRQVLPYAVLFVAILFQFAAIALFAMYDGCSLFDGELPTSENFTLALTTVAQIFSWWSMAALFYSIAMFIQARERNQNLWDRSRCSRLLFVLHTALFASVTILGTVALGLYANYETSFYLGTADGNGLTQMYNNYEDVLHFADAFLYMTSSDVAITAAMTYRTLRHKGRYDPVSRIKSVMSCDSNLDGQVMKYILQIVNPLYFLFITSLLAFNIVFSPAVYNKILAASSASFRLSYILSLVNNIFFFLLLTLVITSLLLMARKEWRTGDVGGK